VIACQIATRAGTIAPRCKLTNSSVRRATIEPNAARGAPARTSAGTFGMITRLSHARSQTWKVGDWPRRRCGFEAIVLNG
jgi:hypothetical protein